MVELIAELLRDDIVEKDMGVIDDVSELPMVIVVDVLVVVLLSEEPNEDKIGVDVRTSVPAVIVMIMLVTAPLLLTAIAEEAEGGSDVVESISIDTVESSELVSGPVAIVEDIKVVVIKDSVMDSCVVVLDVSHRFDDID